MKCFGSPWLANPTAKNTQLDFIKGLHRKCQTPMDCRSLFLLSTETKAWPSHSQRKWHRARFSIWFASPVLLLLFSQSLHATKGQLHTKAFLFFVPETMHSTSRVSKRATLRVTLNRSTVKTLSFSDSLACCFWLTCWSLVKRCFLSPAEKRWFRRKMARTTLVRSTHANKRFCSWNTPETDKNDANHSRKITVCQKNHRLHHPDFTLINSCVIG